MKKLAVMFVAALFVAGCGGGTSGAPAGNPATGTTTPGNPSNNTSVCTYTKRVGKGSVYVEMAVTPVSLERTACSDLNSGFGGRSIPTAGRMGTGRVYCRWNKLESSSTSKLGVFASSRATGVAFCRSFNPGPGFKPYP
jgi:hypothetical protein